MPGVGGADTDHRHRPWPAGSSGRTRTYDQAINSRPLYQLSYAGIGAEAYLASHGCQGARA